jgi:ribosomal protein S18 acetylase RimI-like enzyme
MEIRRAVASDANELVQCDEIARRDPARVAFIQSSIRSSRCLVAVEAGRAIGYAVTTDTFFGHHLVELVYVGQEHRRRGIGRALVAAIERDCPARKLFASTNQSNTAMQGLLTSLGYQPSGEIHNLDDGDPELIYLKHREG